MVDEYENAHDTPALWSRLMRQQQSFLKSYECGMMSKETYDSVRDVCFIYPFAWIFDESNEF
jgi:hypothetical protein